MQNDSAKAYWTSLTASFSIQTKIWLEGFEVPQLQKMPATASSTPATHLSASKLHSHLPLRSPCKCLRKRVKSICL